MRLPAVIKARVELPRVVRVVLSRQHKFMYEAVVLSDQQHVYLFLETGDGTVAALVFASGTFKFGAPNDEALGSHPLAQFGLAFYDFFEVLNSPWVKELTAANRGHPKHRDSMFADQRHFIATFKDNTFEIVSNAFKECFYTKAEVRDLFIRQIESLR